MKGYNDDLVMSFSIGLWVRDKALRLSQEGIDLTKRALGCIGQATYGTPVYGGNKMENDPWTQKINGEDEDLTWLIR